MVASPCPPFGIASAPCVRANRSKLLIAVMLVFTAFAVEHHLGPASGQQYWYRGFAGQATWQGESLPRFGSLTAIPGSAAQIPPPTVRSSAIQSAGKAVVPPVVFPISAGYRPPTSRPIQEPFREPIGKYGAGNRGIDYAVVAGDEVRSIGAGTVVFAGQVAGENYVTVLHPDGLRSSYSYLGSIAVLVGSVVRRGEELGRSSDRFQLGVRDGERYIDPQLLFDRAAGFAVLVRLRYGIPPVRQLR